MDLGTEHLAWHKISVNSAFPPHSVNGHENSWLTVRRMLEKARVLTTMMVDFQIESVAVQAESAHFPPS